MGETRVRHQDKTIKREKEDKLKLGAWTKCEVGALVEPMVQIEGLSLVEKETVDSQSQKQKKSQRVTKWSILKRRGGKLRFKV